MMTRHAPYRCFNVGMHQMHLEMPQMPRERPRPGPGGERSRRGLRRINPAVSLAVALARTRRTRQTSTGVRRSSSSSSSLSFARGRAASVSLGFCRRSGRACGSECGTSASQRGWPGRCARQGTQTQLRMSTNFENPMEDSLPGDAAVDTLQGNGQVSDLAVGLRLVPARLTLCCFLWNV